MPYCAACGSACVVSRYSGRVHCLDCDQDTVPVEGKPATNRPTAEMVIPDPEPKSKLPQVVDIDYDAQVVRVMLPVGWTASVMPKDERREMSTEACRCSVVVKVGEEL